MAASAGNVITGSGRASKTLDRLNYIKPGRQEGVTNNTSGAQRKPDKPSHEKVEMVDFLDSRVQTLVDNLPQSFRIRAEALLEPTATLRQVEHRAYKLFLEDILNGQYLDFDIRGLSTAQADLVVSGFQAHINSLKSSSPVLLDQGKQGGEPQKDAGEENSYEDYEEQELDRDQQKDGNQDDEEQELDGDQQDDGNQNDEKDDSTKIAQQVQSQTSNFIDLANTSSSSDSSSSSEEKSGEAKSGEEKSGEAKSGEERDA